MCAYYTSGKIVIVCSSSFQITEKLMDFINSHHSSTELFMLLYMYAQAILLTRQIHINYKPSVSLAPKLLSMHIRVHSMKLCTHMYAQSCFISLTQMSVFLSILQRDKVHHHFTENSVGCTVHVNYASV